MPIATRELDSRNLSATRLVRIEKVVFGAVVHAAIVPASSARAILDLPQPSGHRWRIEPPDATGRRRPDDAARHAADCAACGENNPYTLVRRDGWRRAG